MKSRETHKLFPAASRLVPILAMAAVAMVMAGCSDFNRAIGKQKSAPDEFEVVVRPPLSLPPGFAKSPEEIDAEEETAALDAQTRAGKALGSETIVATGYDALFDFDAIPENVREKVDEETYGIQFERRIPLQIIFGGLPDIGPTLDKIAEDQRLRKNLREGLLPTDGEILAKDELSGETVIVK